MAACPHDRKHGSYPGCIRQYRVGGFLAYRNGIDLPCTQYVSCAYFSVMLIFLPSAYIDSKNAALDHSSKGVDYAELCSTFVQTGPALHTCRLSNGAVCGIPFEGNSRSIRMHLRKHGHQQQENTTLICPWEWCLQKIQYKNVARHIQSTHLHVKLRCEQCGKTFTRKNAMMKHCGKA